MLDAGTRIFHFDVGDGHFVPPVTIGPVVLPPRSLRLIHEHNGPIDYHLMVDNPAHHFPELAESGVAAASPSTSRPWTTSPALIAEAREHGLESRRRV